MGVSAAGGDLQAWVRGLSSLDGYIVKREELKGYFWIYRILCLQNRRIYKILVEIY
jgi:hypothetical protein